MKKWLVATLVLFIVVVVILVIVFTGGRSNDTDDTGEEIHVPINLESTSNLGSISITLSYDSTLLEITDVKPGKLADNAMTDYGILNPGEVNIGIIDSSGIIGNGSIVVISFNVISEKGTSLLTLANVETHNANTLIDIINVASDGNFDAENRAVVAPSVRLTN